MQHYTDQTTHILPKPPKCFTTQGGCGRDETGVGHRSFWVDSERRSSRRKRDACPL